MPAEQLLHIGKPEPVRYVPAAHGMQALKEGDGLNQPGAHLRQTVLPSTGEYSPAWQLSQLFTVGSPVAVLYFPTGQPNMTVPPPQYDPGGQLWHQGARQSDAPGLEPEPAGHAVHADEQPPGRAQYVLAGHST